MTFEDIGGDPTSQPVGPRRQNEQIRRPAKRKSVDEELLTIARNRLLSPRPAVTTDDEFDVYGKNMAHKLRNLPREQRIHAEKLFADVIYQAELGNLSTQSTVLARPFQHTHHYNPEETYRTYGYDCS